MNIPAKTSSTSKLRRFVNATFNEDVQFWERGRLAYNGALLVVTAVMVILHWPESRFLADNLGAYALLAVMANILYTAAYLHEAVLQMVVHQLPSFQRYVRPARWCVLIAGIILGCVLAVMALDEGIFLNPAED